METIIDLNPTLLWQVVTTLAIAPLAYFLKASLERLRQMELCLSRTREQLAREYATMADMHADVGCVLDCFYKLDGKLDRLLTARFGGGE